jgi:hypothetical protein
MVTSSVKLPLIKPRLLNVEMEMKNKELNRRWFA